MQKLTSAPGIPEKKNCKTCGGEYTGESWTRYCPSCRKAAETRPCKNCGKFFTSPNLTASLCPECRAADHAKQEKERIEAFIEKREDALADSLWMPPGKFVFEATLDNFKSTLQSKAFKAVKAFIEKPEKGLLLWGPPGTGKTHLAAAIFNHYWEGWDRLKRQHPEARFLREYDIFSRLRASYQRHKSNDDERPETEEGIIEDFTCALIVIIDDLCKYQPSDTSFRNRIYYEIIDRLWTDGSRIVLTANISPEVLAQELGAPTADRIRDMCQVVELKGVSQRGKETP